MANIIWVLFIFPVPLPGQPTIISLSVTANSISLSWSVPSGSVVTGSMVIWEEAATETESSGANGSGANDGGTSGLISDTSYTILFTTSGDYSITVTLLNAAGSSSPSQPLIFEVTNIEKGNGIFIQHALL